MVLNPESTESMIHVTDSRILDKDYTILSGRQAVEEEERTQSVMFFDGNRE